MQSKFTDFRCKLTEYSIVTHFDGETKVNSLSDHFVGATKECFSSSYSQKLFQELALNCNHFLDYKFDFFLFVIKYYKILRKSLLRGNSSIAYF